MNKVISYMSQIMMTLLLISSCSIPEQPKNNGDNKSSIIFYTDGDTIEKPLLRHHETRLVEIIEKTDDFTEDVLRDLDLYFEGMIKLSITNPARFDTLSVIFFLKLHRFYISEGSSVGLNYPGKGQRNYCTGLILYNFAITHNIIFDHIWTCQIYDWILRNKGYHINPRVMTEIEKIEKILNDRNYKLYRECDARNIIKYNFIARA